MKTLFIVLCTLIIQLPAFAGQSEFDQAVDTLNRLLTQKNMVQNFCPGFKLVLSCGDGVCEQGKGETQKTCAPDCIKSPIRSYNHQTICNDMQAIHAPKNAKEVAQIIKQAIANKLKVRVVGTLHSANDILCTDGIIIQTKNLNSDIKLVKRRGKTLVETDSGVTVFELSEWLDRKGLALAGLPHMGFRDVSVGGAIATGSHGSTPKHSGVISNIVEGIEIVDGKGNISFYSREASDEKVFKALSASLGMLGVVTKVQLATQAQFNLDVKVSYHDEKDILGKNGPLEVVKDCDFGQINWFPGQKKYMRSCGVKTEQAAEQNANNELLNPKVPKMIVKPFKQVLQLGACSDDIMCAIEWVRFQQFKLQPPFLSGKKNKKQLIGKSHRMVSSHLTTEQEGFFQMDWEVAVPQSKAAAAIKAIRALATKEDICLPLVGVFIRFAKAEDKSLLAYTVPDGREWQEGEPVVYFEMPVYLPVGLPSHMLQKYEKRYEEFVHMLITRFSARPHWGKNREWTFELVKKMGIFDLQIKQFKTVVDQFDPHRIFSNDFSRRLEI
jgi:FAD/FMN-containing dehydrogenase